MGDFKKFKTKKEAKEYASNLKKIEAEVVVVDGEKTFFKLARIITNNKVTKVL